LARYPWQSVQARSKKNRAIHRTLATVRESDSLATSVVCIEPPDLGKSLTVGASTIILAAASCLMIADSDQRAYCRALESGNPARCVEIADHNLRQRCRVELGDDPAQCNTIGDTQQRALCQAKER
jgi:hypothetical protein